MHRSKDRILTTHVGSLPRDSELTALIFAKDSGADYDHAAFEDCVAHSVKAVVAPAGRGRHRPRQRRRDQQDQLRHLRLGPAHRFRRRLAAPAPRTSTTIPAYRDSGSPRPGGTPSYARPAASARYGEGPGAARRDIAQLQAAIGRRQGRDAFMNAASPGVIAVFQPNRLLPDARRLPRGARRGHARRVRADRGGRADAADRQPGPGASAATSSSRTCPTRSSSRAPSSQVEALNHALANVPPETGARCTSAGATTRGRTPTTSPLEKVCRW